MHSQYLLGPSAVFNNVFLIIAKVNFAQFISHRSTKTKQTKPQELMGSTYNVCKDTLKRFPFGWLNSNSLKQRPVSSPAQADVWNLSTKWATGNKLIQITAMLHGDSNELYSFSGRRIFFTLPRGFEHFWDCISCAWNSKLIRGTAGVLILVYVWDWYIALYSPVYVVTTIII